jgi:hypothetical protein
MWKESITLLSPDAKANIIASSEPLDPGIDSLRYAEIQGQLLEEGFPGYVSEVFEPTSAFGFAAEGYLRQFQWSPPDGEPVMQYQIYYADGGRGYTATATVRVVDSSPTITSVLTEVLRGLAVNH